jgi:hypothetical protein
VGVEPTTLAAKDRINGFEGHEDHRTPFASAQDYSRELVNLSENTECNLCLWSDESSPFQLEEGAEAFLRARSRSRGSVHTS